MSLAVVFRPRLTHRERGTDKGPRQRLKTKENTGGNPGLLPLSFTLVSPTGNAVQTRVQDKGQRRRKTPDPTLVFHLCLSPSSHPPRTRHRQGSKTRAKDEGKHRTQPLSFAFVFHPHLTRRERGTDKGPRQRTKTKVVAVPKRPHGACPRLASGFGAS